MRRFAVNIEHGQSYVRMRITIWLTVRDGTGCADRAE
jgi:hypothetical protein